jgi:hypothetical protein
MCSVVTTWLLNAEEGDFYEIESIKNLQNFIIHNELRARIVNIWTDERDGMIVVEKVTAERRHELEILNPNELKRYFRFTFYIDRS